ncbi:MAG TPA: hypothetical protein VNA25_04375, partial [Phycisphaerae bacterium]|nr:hypothetical protein [Phycisphaerae bacterium]
MVTRVGGYGRKRLVAAGMAAVVALVAAGAARAADYIQQDAGIAGGEIYTFQDGGEQVTVVVGNFRLAVGQRVLSGRDAVIWIKTFEARGATRHDVVVYIEGDAKVVDVGGATTTDQVMLVELHVQGRVTAKGRMVARPLKDLPLYARAKAQRAANDRAKAARAATQPIPPEAPPVVIATRPTTRPVGPAPTTRPKPLPPAPAGPTKARVVQPVTLYAKQFTSEKQEGRRVVIARGNVYLSQGDEGSDLFLELRSQAAVIFIEPRTDVGPRSPLSPEVSPLELAPNDPNGAREAIVGAYLVGDVVISRGERYLRGREAYYDFTADRAIVREPVFRTRQEQRNIPIFVRASEARMLSAREMWFKDAKVSTSDFYTPTYSVNSRVAYVMDKTHYDEKGVRVSREAWHGKQTHVTGRIRGVPVLYWPFSQGEFKREHTAMRKAQIGRDGKYGFGVETEWYLFRLLGLVPPEGFSGRAELAVHERGLLIGTNLKYARQSYSGHAMLYGVADQEREDDFGDERENIVAPRWRGRILARHKQLFEDDWEVQFELSYLCDRNFMEQFFPQEFFGGKEQETLIYAKKQRDNWAFTALLQYRLNRFLTQTESAPDLGLYLLGEPLLNDRLTFFHESRAGLKRYRTGNEDASEASRVFPRFDTRNEIDFPLHLGPLNLVHYATGRITAWEDAPAYGNHCRPYGQVGLKANTHIWRQDAAVESRVWDVHGLRHIITPQAVGFLSTTGKVEPGDIFPLEADSEQHLIRMSGFHAGLYTRLQTRRGQPGGEQTVDWMRMNVVAGVFDTV